MALHFRMLAIVLRPSSRPRLDRAPWISQIPPVSLSFAIRTTSTSISLAVCGRPASDAYGRRILFAMSFRCQRSKVSGVTMVAISASILLPSSRALAARLRRWSSVKRTRRLPSWARRILFSSRRYSIACCCC